MAPERPKRVGSIERCKRRFYTLRVRKFTRWLHVNEALRSAYYHLIRLRGGVSVELDGHVARFRARSPWELRMLEESSSFGGEAHVLERLTGVVRQGDVVYDIGSNFGFYAILLARFVGPKGLVVAFEPGAEAHRHLLENVALNGLSNVRAFRVALGEGNGTAKLYLADVSGDSSLLPRGEGGGRYEEVEIVRGDCLVSDKGLPVPRIVKIDVEGSEWTVMRGLRQTLAEPDCELVCCEVHRNLLPRGVTPEDVSDLIKSLGFTQMSVLERGSAEYHIIASKP